MSYKIKRMRVPEDFEKSMKRLQAHLSQENGRFMTMCDTLSDLSKKDVTKLYRKRKRK